MMKIMINVYALYIIINMMNLYQFLNLDSVTKSKLSEYLYNHRPDKGILLHVPMYIHDIVPVTLTLN